MNEIEIIIDEFFQMENGQLIADVDRYVYLTETIRIKRRVLKHVVESRKDDDYSKADLHTMFSRIPAALANADMKKLNNNKRYAGSLIAFKLFREETRALLVVHLDSSSDGIEIINCYYRNVSKTNPFSR